MARRQALARLRTSDCQHPGLLWQRLVPGLDQPELDRHYTQTSNTTRPAAAYQAAFHRWSAAMDAWPGTTRATATTATALTVGLGGGSVTETGITLHHTYGVPYLPGSALKGLARRAATEFPLNDRDRAVLFGSADDQRAEAGYLTFWDGWLDPKHAHPLARDVITPHHPRYYATRGQTPPTDFDDPTPVPFLTVKPGIVFHLAVSAPAAPDWVHTALTILTWGLHHLGLGGKTATGYGTMRLTQEPA